MPQHKSNKKRLITAEKSRIRNRHVRSTIVTSLHKLQATKKQDEAKTVLANFFSLLDKASHKSQGGFTSNKVARFKAKGHKILASKTT